MFIDLCVCHAKIFVWGIDVVRVHFKQNWDRKRKIVCAHILCMLVTVTHCNFFTTVIDDLDRVASLTTCLTLYVIICLYVQI